MISTATATTYYRDPSKILGRVELGDTVVIEKHGEPCAVVIPYPRRTSGAQLARRLRQLNSAPEAADTLEALIKGMDDASRRSLDPHSLLDLDQGPATS